MNKYEQRSKISYDKKAENYDDTFDGKFTVKFKQILLDNVAIQENCILADIACGNGRLLKMLAEKHKFIGYGVDISEEMIKQAKRLNPDMQFYAGSCERMPSLEDGSIHTMTVCAAFHHFPDVDAFAKEAERIMKHDGLLYIAEINLPAVLRAVFNPFLRFSKAGDVRFYSSKEIVSLFERYGFVLEKTIINGKVQLVVLRKANDAKLIAKEMPLER